MQVEEKCPICQRIVPEDKWEKHHLIPKCKKGKDTILVCVSCGDMIHKLIPLNELKKDYNTLEKLREHPDIKKWVGWIQKKPYDFSVCMKGKKKK
jgi:hypothetical protein